MKKKPLAGLGKLLFATAAVSLLAGCIEKEKVAKIGDAENILITDAGAVLVTGGESVVGIVQQGSDLGATDSLIDDPGSCTGMAQSGDNVFVVCSKPYITFKNWRFKAGNDTRLFHAKDKADPRQMQFTLIDDPDPGEGILDVMVLPNGMAFAPDGGLLIADYNLLGQGNVGKVELSYSGNSVSVVGFDQTFAGAQYGIDSPNGVRVADDKLYLSDNNKVRRLYFDSNGGLDLSVQIANGDWKNNDAANNVVYQGGTLDIVDDIMPFCGGVALTSYVDGRLIYVAQNEDQYRTWPGSFSFPSSLAVAKGPLFDDNTLLVTEKGVLLEPNTNIGNRLSAVPTDLNLNDPLTCEAINEL